MQNEYTPFIRLVGAFFCIVWRLRRHRVAFFAELRYIRGILRAWNPIYHHGPKRVILPFLGFLG